MRLCALALISCFGLAACEEPVPAHRENASWGEQRSAQSSDRVFLDLQGKERRINDWRGKVVLVNFWATWCTPCLREIPALQAARQKYGGQGFEVLGVAIDQQEPLRRFVAEWQIDYPILDGESGGMELLASLGNESGGLPFSVLFDREGKIRHTHLGELTRDQIEEQIEKLL